MGIPYTQRVGEKHNMLTIISIAGKENTGRRTKVRCIVRCDCGVEKNVRIEGVVNDMQYSCGCTRKKFLNSASRKMYNNYRNSALNRGYCFELTENEFNVIATGDCHYCGVKPSSAKEVYGDSFILNGVDRKDNSLGYIFGNCLPCCTVCNRAKSDMSYADFVAWLERVGAFVFNDKRAIVFAQSEEQQEVVH